MPLHAYETTTPSRQYQSSPFTRHSPFRATAGFLFLPKSVFALLRPNRAMAGKATAGFLFQAKNL